MGRTRRRIITGVGAAITSSVIGTTVSSDSTAALEADFDTDDLDDVEVWAEDGQVGAVTIEFDIFTVSGQNLTPSAGDLEVQIVASVDDASTILYETILEVGTAAPVFEIDDVFQSPDNAEFDLIEQGLPASTFEATEAGEAVENEVTIEFSAEHAGTEVVRELSSFTVRTAKIIRETQTFEEPDDTPALVDVSEFFETIVTIEGAGGGDGGRRGFVREGDGGTGGYIVATADIENLDELYAWVGEGGETGGDATSGLFAGGAGGTGDLDGGSGGGCSAVTTTAIESANPEPETAIEESIAIADGGGGGGSGNAGLLGFVGSDGGGGGGARGGNAGEGDGDGEAGDGTGQGGDGGDSGGFLGIEDGQDGEDGGQEAGALATAVEETTDGGGNAGNASITLEFVGPVLPSADNS